MHSSFPRIGIAALLLSTTATAQTYTSCNPLTEDCPPNPALGRAVDVDFTEESDSFTPQGEVSYGPDGAEFTVAQSGDSPLVMSKWYIMFGHVEFDIKAAPGVGVVSSAVLQSDCLDEIDFEWLGGDPDQVQSNYFGKGKTTDYNRGAFHAAPGSQDDFHKYTIDWTSEQIVWQVDGVTVRAMGVADAAEGQYPQTPMMVKVGSWSGGDPANDPGTIQWAGGRTDYTAGPYTMYVKSVAVTDYSTGNEYVYTGSEGTWQSIKSEGGEINPEGGKNTPTDTSDAPTVTSAAPNAPVPFDGANTEVGSTDPKPSGWPWSGEAPASEVSSSRPSSSPEPSPSSPLLPTSPVPEPEIMTVWDHRGFPVPITIPAGEPTPVITYDDRGYLEVDGENLQPSNSDNANEGASTENDSSNNPGPLAATEENVAADIGLGSTIRHVALAVQVVAAAAIAA